MKELIAQWLLKPTPETTKYSEDELMARLRFFIGICLALTLTGIVFVVLYSIIFVTQPLNAISPIDQKFFELIIPVATFLTGTLSGIMLGKNNPEAEKEALKAANAGWNKPPTPPTGAMMPQMRPMGIMQPMNPMMGGFQPMMGGMNNADLGLMPGQSPKFTDD